MPELPEVETIRRQLAPRLIGRRLGMATSHWSAKFTPALNASDAAVTEVGRRGKYLLVALSRPDRLWPWGSQAELVIHLGMTGSLRLMATDIDDDPYVRARWPLDGGELVFRDVRRFGRLAVVEPGRYDNLPTLRDLGPEPFDEALDANGLWRALRPSRRAIKTQLLSQRPIAGVGNIYADEACWLAMVNPADRTISRERSADLLDALRSVLTAGLEHGGTTLRDYVDADGSSGTNQLHLRCYGRSGAACDRCGTLLRSRTLDARTTTWCPECQPRR